MVGSYFIKILVLKTTVLVTLLLLCRDHSQVSSQRVDWDLSISDDAIYDHNGRRMATSRPPNALTVAESLYFALQVGGNES